MLKTINFIALVHCTLSLALNNSNPSTTEPYTENTRNFTSETAETLISYTIQQDIQEIETLSTTTSETSESKWSSTQSDSRTTETESTTGSTSGIEKSVPKVTKTFVFCFKDEETDGATCIKYITRTKFQVIVFLLSTVVLVACALSVMFFCTCACSIFDRHKQFRL
jgi:hypothetical protein